MYDNVYCMLNVHYNVGGCCTYFVGNYCKNIFYVKSLNWLKLMKIMALSISYMQNKTFSDKNTCLVSNCYHQKSLDKGCTLTFLDNVT